MDNFFLLPRISGGRKNEYVLLGIECHILMWHLNFHLQNLLYLTYCNHWVNIWAVRNHRFIKPKIIYSWCYLRRYRTIHSFDNPYTLQLLPRSSFLYWLYSSLFPILTPWWTIRILDCTLFSSPLSLILTKIFLYQGLPFAFPHHLLPSFLLTHC